MRQWPYLALLGLIVASPCQAQGLDWDWSIYRYHAVVRHHHHRAPVRYYREPEGEEREAVEPAWQCIDKVHVVGSQWVTEDGAEESARKAWMEETRFRVGEQWMDVEHAADYEKRCTRSSIGEAAGQMLFRCEVAARPCRPPLQKADNHK